MRDRKFRPFFADFYLPIFGALTVSVLGVAMSTPLASGEEASAAPTAEQSREDDVRWLTLPEGIAPESWGFK